MSVVLSIEEFNALSQLIYRYAGISLAPTKRELLHARLSRRLRALGVSSFSEYAALVEGNNDERERFVNALTTNLTSFFRESHHFDALANILRVTSRREPFRIWSAACSSGQEAYSIAMTVCETARTGGRNAVTIVASDIDTNVLSKAANGVYDERAIAEVSTTRVQSFFDRGTSVNAGYIRIRSELRNMIRFERINLLDDYWSIEAPLDVVFCRNVLIYFDRPTQRAVLEKIAAILRPNGLLMTGHSEVLLQLPGLFTAAGNTIYRRRS